MSASSVEPRRAKAVGCPFEALGATRVDLHVLPNLTGLRDAWNGSVHVGGIRLRDAVDWGGS